MAFTDAEEVTVNCAFCGRHLIHNKRHHLIPAMKHNKKAKRDYTSEERKRTVDSCKSCHDHLHALFTEKELAEEYNTVAKILADERMRKFVAWISKKPPDWQVSSKRANRRA